MPAATRRSKRGDAAAENAETVPDTETVPNVESTARDGSNVDENPGSISVFMLKTRVEKEKKAEKKAGKSSRGVEGLPALVHAKTLVKESARAQELLDSDNRVLESASCLGEIPADFAKVLAEDFAKARAKEILTSVQEELEELNQFRDHTKDPTATIIPFSSLTWPKLETRFGVIAPLPGEINLEMCTSILESAEKIYSQSATKAIYDPKAWNHRSVRNHLELINDLVLKRKEASAWISINEWILGLGKYLKTDRFWVLIIPELTIQDARNRKNTTSNLARVDYNDMKTILTGAADYALIAQSESGWDKEQFQGFKNAANTAPSLVELVNDLKNINIIIVEAKDILMKNLEMHIPQVVGQCVAVMRVDPDRQAVPFYLTNGKLWVFGVVACKAACSSGDGDHLYESFVLPSFNMDTGDISELGPKAETDFHKYNTFMRTLIAWAKLHPLDIVNVIVKELGSSRN
ncbi:hypothetical protein BJ912DRAFT_1067981 [Pholiota molesta]|nr:hypothetical protein BJ912DRAFT_1067981 [Pholiota molesta]